MVRASVSGVPPEQDPTKGRQDVQACGAPVPADRVSHDVDGPAGQGLDEPITGEHVVIAQLSGVLVVCRANS